MVLINLVRTRNSEPIQLSRIHLTILSRIRLHAGVDNYVETFQTIDGRINTYIIYYIFVYLYVCIYGVYIVYVGSFVGENSHLGSVSKSSIAGRRIVSAEQTSVNETSRNCIIYRCVADRVTAPFDLQLFTFEKIDRFKTVCTVIIILQQ